MSRREIFEKAVDALIEEDMQAIERVEARVQDQAERQKQALRGALDSLKQKAQAAKAADNARWEALAAEFEQDRKDLATALDAADQALTEAVRRMEERDRARNRAVLARIHARLERGAATIDRLNARAATGMQAASPVRALGRAMDALQEKVDAFEAVDDARRDALMAGLEHAADNLDAAIDAANQVLSTAIG